MRGIKTFLNEITSNIRRKHSSQNLHLKVRRLNPEKHIIIKVQNKLYPHIHHITGFMEFREAAQLRQTVAKSKVRQTHPPKNT